MCLKRTESGDEPKWNAPRKKIPSTGPAIGRPSAVTVARVSRHMPSSRSASCAAGEPPLGRVDAEQVLAGGRVAAVEQILQRREVLGCLVHVVSESGAVASL